MQPAAGGPIGACIPVREWKRLASPTGAENLLLPFQLLGEECGRGKIALPGPSRQQGVTITSREMMVVLQGEKESSPLATLPWEAQQKDPCSHKQSLESPRL